MTSTQHRGQTGRYILSAKNDDLVRAMSDAPRRDGSVAHPIHGYLGALGGLSLPIGTFCRGIGINFDAGPVLGRCEMAFHTPFHVDTSYDVILTVDDLQRKPSRTFGSADHLSLTITLNADGVAASTLRFTMITPVGSQKQAATAVTTDDSAPPPAPALPYGPVSGPDMAVWCRLLNDDNAIHLTTEAATLAGYNGKRVNPGPANLAYLVSARMRLHPALHLSALQARFHDNVLEGDMLDRVLSPQGADAALTRAGQCLLSVTFRE